jgi:hypothetical protein
MLIALYNSRNHMGLPSPKAFEALYLNLFYFLEHIVASLVFLLSSAIPSLLGSNQAKKEVI